MGNTIQQGAVLNPLFEEPEPEPEQPQDAKYNQEKLLGVTYTMSALNIAALGFTCYLVFKIYRLVKLTDLPMVLSILSLSIALMFFLVYNIMMLIGTEQIHNYDGWNFMYLNTDRGVHLRISIDQLKVMFMFFAFVFDLYKWTVFIVAT